MMARHDSSHVKFLMDFEGPSDRYQVSTDSGGHVPVRLTRRHSGSNGRPAGSSGARAGAYLRISDRDRPHGPHPGNHHAIALIDSATSTEHGGVALQPGRGSTTR